MFFIIIYDRMLFVSGNLKFCSSGELLAPSGGRQRMHLRKPDDSRSAHGCNRSEQQYDFKQLGELRLANQCNSFGALALLLEPIE